MKFRINNKYFRWGLTAFLVISASICFYYLLFHGTKIKQGLDTISGILMPIVFGFAMSYLMTPVLNMIEYRILIPVFNKCKIKESQKRGSIIRALGIVLTLFLFIAITYGLISMMLSQIVPSITNIVSNFDGYIANFTKWLNKLLSDYPEIESTVLKTVNKYSVELETWLNESVLSKSSALLKTVSLSVIGVLKILWNTLVGLMISVYVLASKEKFAGQAKKLTYAVFDRGFANIIINNFRFTHKTFIGFISGKVLDSIIIGLLCFIGTSLLQTPYAALVSLIVGVTNVIPFFGPYLGAIPCTILIFVVDPLHVLNCVYFVLFILVLQQFDGNFLGPMILGDSTGLASFWVIFSITLFGGLFGVMGMIVGVPIFAVFYAAVRSFVNNSLRKKGIPQETNAYINVGAITDDGFCEYVPEYKLKKGEKEKDGFGKDFLCSLYDLDTMTAKEPEAKESGENAEKAAEKSEKVEKNDKAEQKNEK